MKYAGKTFTLYASQPVAIQGSDSLYTYQNTGTGTATIVGSNNAVTWTAITTVTSGDSFTGSHAYAFLMMTGSTQVSVSRGVGGGLDVNSSNPLPVAQTGYANEGAAITSQPVPIGLEGRTSSKTSVTSGQAVRPISTVDGRQVIRLNSIPENEWVYAAASGGITNTTTAATLVAAQAAGVRNYLTSLQLSSDALGAATEIAIRDGAGGTVLWRGKIGTAGIAGVITIQFSDPLKSTAATLLEVVTLSASVFGGVYVNAQGYIAP